MSDIQAVITDDGLEYRDPAGNLIYRETGSWQYPPSDDALEAIFEYENVNTRVRRVLRLMAGIPDIQDERS